MINRRSREEPLFIDDPFISILGGLTPAGLTAIGGAHVVEDGLVERLLVVWPDTNPPQWVDGAPEASPDEYARVFEFVREFADSDPHAGAHRIRMHDDARVVFRDWANAHYARSCGPVTPFQGFAAKLVGTCGRLLLVLHAARTAARETTSETADPATVAAAIKLTEDFAAHAGRVHGALVPAGGQNLGAALRWIRDHGGRVARRDFQRANVSGVKTARDVDEVFAELAAAGLGSISNASHNRVFFELHDGARPGRPVGLSGVGSVTGDTNSSVDARDSTLDDRPRNSTVSAAAAPNGQLFLYGNGDS